MAKPRRGFKAGTGKGFSVWELNLFTDMNAAWMPMPDLTPVLTRRGLTEVDYTALLRRRHKGPRRGQAYRLLRKIYEEAHVRNTLDLDSAPLVNGTTQ